MDTLISLVREHYLFILAVVGSLTILVASTVSEDQDPNELEDKSRQVGVGRVTLELIKK